MRALRLVSKIGLRFYSSEVRWLYATDVPKEKPAYFQYEASARPSKFDVFSAVESQKIEQAFQAHLRHNTKPEPVLVKEDGLFEVDVQSRSLRPVYWEGPVYEVFRGLWLYKRGDKYIPCPDELANELEAIYKSLEFKPDYDGSLEHVLNDGTRVMFGAGGKTVEFVNSDGLFSSRPKLVRGYKEDVDKVKGDQETPKSQHQDSGWTFASTAQKIQTLYSSSSETKTESEIDRAQEHMLTEDYGNSPQQAVDPAEFEHLVLCVHGIGQKLSRRIESVNFVHDINVFRKQLKTVFKESPELQEAAESSTLTTQVVPILWRNELAFGSPSAGLQLEDINVEGVEVLRNLAGDVILDIFLYNNSMYRTQILDIVTAKLNAAYNKFCAFNPKFARNPRVSIIGHSLGAPIVFDILSEAPNRLEFVAENFFTFGSPLGMFQLLRGEPLDREGLSYSKSLYNVFHPSDPISYRIEPLIDHAASRLKPVSVPFTKGGLTSQIQELAELGNRLTRGATSAWNSLSLSSATVEPESRLDHLKSAIKSGLTDLESLKELVSEGEKGDKVEPEKVEPEKVEDEDGVKCRLAEFNTRARVDYVLQQGVFDISLITAIASHMSYFEDADIASFVLKELYNR